jgi:hypothetical protein
MPKALGRRMNHLKTLTATAAVAAVAGWVAGSVIDPTRAALALVGVGGAGTVIFTLRPYRRPHSSSSLPLFPVLVVA